MTWLSIGRYTCISDTRSVGGSRSKPVLYYFRFLWSHPESNRLLPFIYTQRQSRNPFTQYQHIKLHSTWHLFFLILWRPSESKWVNPDAILYGVNSLRLGGLHISATKISTFTSLIKNIFVWILNQPIF